MRDGGGRGIEERGNEGEGLMRRGEREESCS